MNIEHIIAETPRDRFPEPYRSMADFALQTGLQEAINNARERVRRSYKTAIPEYYRAKSNFCCHCVLVIRSVPTLACNRTPSYVLSRRDMPLDMAYNKRVKLRVRTEIGFNHRSC